MTHWHEHAFTDADLRLLETLAASMSVALDNARLFGGTQRLLKEAEARNAEMPVINSTQRGMAGSLDFHGIVDLVGEQLRSVFGVGDLGIHVWDEGAQEIVALYAVEHGVRLPVRRNPGRAATPDGQRHAWRPRSLPGSGHGRLCDQADPGRRTGARAAADAGPYGSIQGMSTRLIDSQTFAELQANLRSSFDSGAADAFRSAAHASWWPTTTRSTGCCWAVRSSCRATR
jgi:hypothetical protein